MNRTHPSFIRRFAMVAAAGLLLVTAACGGGDDDEPTTTGPGATTEGAEASGNDAAAPGEQDDANNPLVLGYQLAGSPGTALELEVVAVADGQEQPTMDQAPILRDEPSWFLLTTFVDSATITASVVEGESATLEVFYGRAVNPDNPTLGVEIVESIETVDVGPEPVTVEFP